jgi:hypothetical protein
MRGAIPLLPNTPSWLGAEFKHSDNFTFLPFTIIIIGYIGDTYFKINITLLIPNKVLNSLPKMDTSFT